MALKDIPFYGGWNERGQQHQQEDAQKMQQASGLMGLIQAAQKQQARQAAAQKAAQYEAASAALPADATEDQVLKATMPFMTADKRGEAIISSRDRQTRLAEAKALREDNMMRHLLAIDQRAEAERIRSEDRNLAAADREAASLRHDNLQRMSLQLQDSARREGLELRREMAANRPERAPTMRDIVDPTNPAQMITVDVGKYKGGSVGSEGVLGIAGKEPSAAKRDEKAESGKDLLKSELDALRMSFDFLNQKKAIPSSERGGMSNAAASVQASGVGQLAGKVFGTQEQDARNRIQSARLRIMNAIKNATGMSAQQMNSNVELQTWLSSLTDPSKSYESNIQVIDDISSAFLKPKKDATPATPTAPSALDALLEKYK